VNVPDPAAETVGEHPAVQVDPEALYLQHHGVMHAAAREILGTTYDSEIDNAVGQVMATLIAMHRKGSMPAADNWAAYLKRAARNAALAIVRERTKTTSPDRALDAGERFPADTEPDPVSDELLMRIRATEVHNAMDQLDARSNRIITGRYFEDLTDHALGGELDLTGQRIGQIRRAAERRLVELLRGE